MKRFELCSGAKFDPSLCCRDENWHSSMRRPYGIRGKVLNWVSDLLKNRRRVLVNGKPSDWCPVQSGIPQGSVLGPVLFVVYINDLPDLVESLVQMFADDTKVFRRIGGMDDCKQLQEDLTNLQQ